MIVAFVPFLLSYPLFYILTANKKWFPLAHQYRRIWGNLICFLAGLRKKVTFEEPLDTNRVYIIAPNHCSYLDIVSTTCDIPIYFNYMAKYELSKIPFGVSISYLDLAKRLGNEKVILATGHLW